MRLRDHEGVKGKRDAYPFDPRLLRIDETYNVRDLSSPDAVEKLGELKESIRANGVRTPLEVRMSGEDVFIVAGHRRHKAVIDLIAEGEPIETVLVLHEVLGTNDAERALNLIISNSGEPLKPLEVAEVVRRLSGFGWEHANIAKRLGWKSAASVKQHLDMLAMPAAVQQQVRDGEVSASNALRVVRETRDAKTDPEFAAELIRNAAEEKRRLGKKGRATPKETRKALDKVREPKAPKPAPVAPPASVAAHVPVHAQPPEPETGASSGLPATENMNGAAIEESEPVREFERQPLMNGDADADEFDPVSRQDILETLRALSAAVEESCNMVEPDLGMIVLRDSDVRQAALAILAKTESTTP